MLSDRVCASFCLLLPLAVESIGQVGRGVPVYFLPRCMECRRGLAMRILSVRPYVRQSNA